MADEGLSIFLKKTDTRGADWTMAPSGTWGGAAEAAGAVGALLGVVESDFFRPVTLVAQEFPVWDSLPASSISGYSSADVAVETGGAGVVGAAFLPL